MTITDHPLPFSSIQPVSDNTKTINAVSITISNGLLMLGCTETNCPKTSTARLAAAATTQTAFISLYYLGSLQPATSPSDLLPHLSSQPIPLPVLSSSTPIPLPVPSPSTKKNRQRDLSRCLLTSNQ